MLVIYDGILQEAEAFRSSPGAGLTYVIDGEYLDESLIQLPSADIIAGRVPPAPFTEAESPFVAADEAIGGGALSQPVEDKKAAAKRGK